jgi:hypothetical protein
MFSLTANLKLENGCSCSERFMIQGRAHGLWHAQKWRIVLDIEKKQYGR